MTKGKIVKKLGNVIYLVELPSGVVWKRHTNQILKNKYELEEEEEDEENEISTEGKKITTKEKTVENSEAKNDKTQLMEKEQSFIEENQPTKEIQVFRRSSRAKKPVVRMNL